jgi:ethanolamine utilization protein EutP
VITKIDQENGNIIRSRKHLSYAGVQKTRIFEVSSVTGQGIEELEGIIHHYMEKYRK